MTSPQNSIRLQIRGGNDFSFLLSADPSWKVSQLKENMLKIYNEIAQSQMVGSHAVLIKSLKRNGFYVANSAKVGSTFNDWDEVTCQITLGKEKEDFDKFNIEIKDSHSKIMDKQKGKKEQKNGAEAKKKQHDTPVAKSKQTKQSSTVNNKQQKGKTVDNEKSEGKKQKEKQQNETLSEGQLLQILGMNKGKKDVQENNKQSHSVPKPTKPSQTSKPIKYTIAAESDSD